MRIFLFLVTLLLVTIPAAAQDPVAVIDTGRDSIYWYASERWDSTAPVPMRIIAGPAEATISFSGARLTPIDPTTGTYYAEIDVKPGLTPVVLTVYSDGLANRAERTVVAEQPDMIDGIDAWGALDATVGELYNPSSFWSNLNIPAAHYQTVVEIDGVKQFSRPGSHFQRSQLPASLMISDATRSVRTLVYWCPNGTRNWSKWKLLASTDGSGKPAVPLGKRAVRILPGR